MSSFRRIISSQINGQRSSLNATRHGLLARTVVLDNECEENFTDGPLSGPEMDAVENVVAGYWRMRRLWAENRLLNDDDEFGRRTQAHRAYRNLQQSQNRPLMEAKPPRVKKEPNEPTL